MSETIPPPEPTTLQEAKAELKEERAASGRIRQFAKTFGTTVVAGLAATMGISAQLFPNEDTAKKTAAATATGLQDVDRQLQATRDQCRAIAAAGVRDAKAETDSVRTLLLGYLLAQKAPTSPGRETKPDELQRTLHKVVSGLGAPRSEALAPILEPTMAVPAPPPPPAPYDQVQSAAAKLEQLSQ